MFKLKKTDRLVSRLRPLYAAAFFNGFVLWYPVEKLFMKNIGFSDTGIGTMIAFYSAIMILAETPSGILADRWSRKGVLMLASVMLALSALIGGISTNETIYMICAGLWGLFFALYSGTYESIIYDTIAEEGRDSKEYEKFFGRISAYDGLALVSGSIIGGLTASILGIRYAYFLTIPLSLLAILFLKRFNEPKLHKSEVYTPIVQHIRSTFGAVLRRSEIATVATVLIAGSITTYLTLEFSQVWVIAFAAPVIFFGPINALVVSTLGLGGLSASFFKIHKYPVMLVALALLTTSSLGLIFLRSLPLIVLCIATLCITIVAIRVVFSRLLHDSLDSKVRAGAASAISTVARIVIIPLSLLFGFISENSGIFNASWLTLGLITVVVVFTLKTYSKGKELPKFTASDESLADKYGK